jgi:CTP synthase (UTP-ammonia lyase)
VSPARLALVGDFQPDVLAHQAIERSMALAPPAMGLAWEWVATTSVGRDAGQRFEGFSGIWLVPASPYASEQGALASITFARNRGVPFLGTCGGFQHALIEFAREVLGLAQASHAETAPDGALAVIAPLSCAMVERRGPVHLTPGSRLREIYGAERSDEDSHCSYGLNPDYERLLTEGDGLLRIAARDDHGEVRAVELSRHPFFLATLYQPERRALTGQLHPLMLAFIRAASASD